MSASNAFSGYSNIGQISLTSSLAIQAVTSDNISVNHSIQFCKPVPNDHFNCPGNVPSTTDCDIYVKDLNNFPLDDIPSGGFCSTDMRISPSEMCYVFLQINNYPGSGYIKHTWKNKDTGNIFYISQLDAPVNPGSSSWYTWTWSIVGHFSWEIDRPGNYQCIIDTTWGSATIDFTVKCTSVWSCKSPYDGYEYDNCGNKQLNSICNPGNLVNGTFDTDLNGWTLTTSGNGVVEWIDSAARLYTKYRDTCSIEQAFIGSKQYISFDYYLEAIWTPNKCLFEFSVDGVVVSNTILSQGTWKGTIKLDTSSYIGRVCKIKFSIISYGFTDETWLWIDNVSEFSPLPPPPPAAVQKAGTGSWIQNYRTTPYNVDVVLMMTLGANRQLVGCSMNQGQYTVLSGIILNLCTKNQYNISCQLWRDGVLITTWTTTGNVLTGSTDVYVALLDTGLWDVQSNMGKGAVGSGIILEPGENTISWTWS